MFEKIDQIDWDSLGLGGSRVKRLFREATSSDLDTSRRAVGEIGGRLANWPAFDDQLGTVDAFKFALQDDIPLHMVPFVIELVSNISLPIEYRSHLLEDLHNAACFVYASKVYTNPIKPDDEIYRTRAQTIRDAVNVGIPVYEALLNHESASLREGAHDILRILQKDIGNSSP